MCQLKNTVCVCMFINFVYLYLHIFIFSFSFTVKQRQNWKIMLQMFLTYTFYVMNVCTFFELT